jgi:hypothetical protein
MLVEHFRVSKRLQSDFLFGKIREDSEANEGAMTGMRGLKSR